MNRADVEPLKFDGEELKKMRLAIRPRVTQQDMANELGLSRETVIILKTIKRQPSEVYH